MHIIENNVTAVELKNMLRLSQKTGLALGTQNLKSF